MYISVCPSHFLFTFWLDLNAAFTYYDEGHFSRLESCPLDVQRPGGSGFSLTKICLR